MTKLVSIIILNWNGWQDTIECVESCRKLDYSNTRILIVDNGSTDSSEAILRERFPDIEIIQTGTNLGFAGGNNAGIRYALAQNADYVWLLNNDTVVDAEALSALVRVAEDDKTVGMVGSKIVYHDNPRLLWYAGAVLDSESPYRMHHKGLGEVDSGQYNELEETGFVTGCSLLANQKMITEIGLIYEGFFLYFEDSDWNIRAQKAGWKLIYCPTSLVYHKVSSSMGGSESPLLRYYYSRNFLYFVNRNFPERFIASLIYICFEYILVNVKKRKFTSATKALQGIYHYFKGIQGPLINWK